MRGAVAVRVVADLGIVAVFGIALPDPGTKAKVAVSPRRGNAERLQWSPQRVAAASPARGRSRTVGLASREPLPAAVLACGTTVPVSTCGYRSAGSGQCPSRRVIGTPSFSTSPSRDAHPLVQLSGPPSAPTLVVGDLGPEYHKSRIKKHRRARASPPSSRHSPASTSPSATESPHFGAARPAGWWRRWGLSESRWI